MSGGTPARSQPISLRPLRRALEYLIYSDAHLASHAVPLDQVVTAHCRTKAVPLQPCIGGARHTRHSDDRYRARRRIRRFMERLWRAARKHMSDNGRGACTRQDRKYAHGVQYQSNANAACRPHRTSCKAPLRAHARRTRFCVSCLHLSAAKSYARSARRFQPRCVTSSVF